VCAGRLVRSVQIKLDRNSKHSRPSVILQQTMNAHLYYRPKLLQVGEFKEAFELAVKEVLGTDAQITVGYPRQTGRAGVRDYIELGVESLRAVVDLNKIQFSLNAKALANSNLFERISVSCFGMGPVEVVSFEANGEESVQCLERFALNLGLEQTEPPEDVLRRAEHELRLEVESRLSALEKAAKDLERTPRCFISFKFDDAQAITEVDRLKRLLAAVHIEWITGEQYEPRRIEDKVKAKLRADVDFVIAVISKAGASTWIRDELADANARGLWIMLLLEDGAKFDKGIFGALEYISFDLAIDQTFSAVLEGINFIKAEISVRDENRSA